MPWVSVPRYLYQLNIGHGDAVMARDILNTNPDEVSQFNDLAAGMATRDISGRPLGNVLEHSLARYRTCYEILEAVRLTAESAQARLGATDKSLAFGHAGAVLQDRNYTTTNPAAHRAPCSIVIAASGLYSAGMHLHETYLDGLNRSHVGWLFKETDIVHVLTNQADSLCERKRRHPHFGFAPILTACCNSAIADPQGNLKQMFYDELVPKFRAAALQRLEAVRRQLYGQFPDVDDISPIVDQHGRLYAAPEQPTDHRKHSPSPAARKTNLQAQVQVLSVYAGSNMPAQSEIVVINKRYEALRRNERQHYRYR
jgi:hypothetical protein